MEIKVMTDSTLWTLWKKQYEGKSWENRKRQTLNLNRFLLELAIVRKINIDWKKNGLESDVCTCFKSVRLCFALIIGIFVFVMSSCSCHGVHWSQSFMCVQNYFRNNINLLLWRWLVPGSLRNFYIFLLSWGKVWICTFFPISPAEYMMQLFPQAALGSCHSPSGEEMGFPAAVKAVTFPIN